MSTPLLLHACCGPCSLEPLRLLKEEGFSPVILWANPNIQPVSEHALRFETLVTWAKNVAHVDIIQATEDRDLWEAKVAPYGFDRAKRCGACYRLRISELCRIAQTEGFSHISTTLAVSPHQLFDVCHQVTEELASEHGLICVWRDFRPYYACAQLQAQELCMYRQNYCGCRFSAAEALLERRARQENKKHNQELSL